MSLSVMSSRFIHAVVCVGISFLFKAEEYPTVCVWFVCVCRVSVDGHTPTFCLSWVELRWTRAYKYLPTQDSPLNSPGFVCGSGVAVPYCISGLVVFEEPLHWLFIMIPIGSIARVPVFPHPRQHMEFSMFVFFSYRPFLRVWSDTSLWFWFAFPSCWYWAPFHILVGHLSVILGVCQLLLCGLNQLRPLCFTLPVCKTGIGTDVAVAQVQASGRECSEHVQGRPGHSVP